MQKNCLFMIAAKGSAQKDCMHASYNRSEYLRLPVEGWVSGCPLDISIHVHSSLKVK